MKVQLYVENKILPEDTQLFVLQAFAWSTLWPETEEEAVASLKAQVSQKIHQENAMVWLYSHFHM